MPSVVTATPCSHVPFGNTHPLMAGKRFCQITIPFFGHQGISQLQLLRFLEILRLNQTEIKKEKKFIGKKFIRKEKVTKYKRAIFVLIIIIAQELLQSNEDRLLLI